MRAPPDHKRIRERAGAAVGVLAALAAPAVLADARRGGAAPRMPTTRSRPTRRRRPSRRCTAASSQRRNPLRARAWTTRYRKLEPLIEKTHDLRYIAEFALRKQWPMLSEMRPAALHRGVREAQRDDVREPLQERFGEHFQERGAGHDRIGAGARPDGDCAAGLSPTSRSTTCSSRKTGRGGSSTSSRTA